MLTLNDVVAQNNATQADVGVGSSRATDEPGSSSRQCKRIQIDDLCLCILKLHEYCIIKTFEERLTINDIVTKNETTQVGVRVGFSHANDESRSSSRQYRHKQIDDLCLYILRLLEY